MMFSAGCCNCKSASVPNDGTVLPTCFCRVPTTLHMKSLYPACNYYMFQDCDLTYGPTPPELQAIGFVGNGFTGGPKIDTITGREFWYYFWCSYNQFFITRIFPHFPDGTPGGSAYRDGILYSWIVGGLGNTCTSSAANGDGQGASLTLLRGKGFPGSDTSCNVQITSGGGGSYGQGPTPAVAMLAEVPGPTGADRPEGLAAELVIARYTEDARWAEGIA